MALIRYAAVAPFVFVVACGSGARFSPPAASMSTASPMPTTAAATTTPPRLIPPTPASASTAPVPLVGVKTPSEFDPPSSSILGVAFADAQHGWLIGIPCGGDNCIVLRTTNDGGRTWHPTGRPNVPLFGQPNSVHNIRLLTERDGWAFGPGLWVTHDAGATWTDQTPPAEVVDINVADGSAWQLHRPSDCQARGAPCIYTLSTSSDSGRSWREQASQPPIRRSQLSMVRHGALDAWIHAFGSALASDGSLDSTPAGGQFLVTHDAGATWQERPDPCTFGWFGDALSLSVDATRLWLVCGGQPGAGSQGPKAVFTSADDGASWDTVWKTAFSPGYVHGIVAISADRALLGSARAGGSVTETLDGGHTWSLAFQEPEDRDAGVFVLPFADALHGWAVAVSAVWRTDTGGDYWERIVP